MSTSSRLVSSEIYDNNARPYRHIEVKPYAASMGAEISGVNAADLNNEEHAELADALYRHKMVFLRGQCMNDDEHASLTERFGTMAKDPYSNRPDVGVLPMVKEADERTPWIFGGGWHTDSPFMTRPPAITILRSTEVPPFGGDTSFANAALAYRALSETMQGLIATLRVHMSAGPVIEQVSKLRKAPTKIGSDETHRQAIEGTYHPLVRTHPATGEKALYVAQHYAIGIEGMSEHEGKLLLDFLVAHVTDHQFTCRLRWESNMLVLWDNRLCLHLAMNDYDGWRRVMSRSMVEGEVPV